MGSKRRRIALSCVDCRRRKVKCDRTMPACIRCQKGGIADKCQYVPYEAVEDQPSTSPQGLSFFGRVPREGSNISWEEEAEDYVRISSGGPLSGPTQQVPPSKRPNQSELIQRLEQKVTSLEAQVEAARCNSLFVQQSLGLPTPASSSSVEHFSSGKKTIAYLEQTLMRGRSFKTQYSGPSHYASILLQFDDLSTFIKEILHYFPAAIGDVETTQKNFKAIRRELDEMAHSLSHEHSDLLDLVPNRATTEILVRQYLQSFETTYRVLHVPTFRRQLDDFWMNPQHADASFVVVLLLIMATVQCVAPQDQLAFLGRSSRIREKATQWVAVCESWLNRQSHKHVKLVTFQVRVLLFIAKRMNTIKIKRLWTSSGELVRLAMSAGLHRDPSIMTGKISTFDKEMRRRLWATIIELELLTAVDKGMPGTVGSADWDCQPPSNVHDEEFDEHSTQLPVSRPLHEFTRTSYLCQSAQSLVLRIEMLAMVNHIQPALTMDIASQFDMRTRQAIAEIPWWSEYEQSIDLYQPSSRLAKTLAKIQLIEFTVLIYQPFATAKENPNTVFFSRAAFRDAAATILELYKELEKVEDLTLRFIRNDAFRAGLCICYDLCTESGSGSTVTFNRNRAVELLEHAMEIQSDRVLQLGQGFHAFWITSAALSLAYSKSEPASQRGKYAGEAAQRVTKMNEKIVMLQEPSVDGATRLGVGEMLSAEAQSVLAKGDGMPSGLEPVPVPDMQLNFDVFNIADIYSLDNFYNFDYI